MLSRLLLDADVPNLFSEEPRFLPWMRQEERRRKHAFIFTVHAALAKTSSGEIRCSDKLNKFSDLLNATVAFLFIFARQKIELIGGISQVRSR
jgi:hypothetical protein